MGGGVPEFGTLDPFSRGFEGNHKEASQFWGATEDPMGMPLPKSTFTMVLPKPETRRKRTGYFGMEQCEKLTVDLSRI